MNKREDQIRVRQELTEAEKLHISAIFAEDIVPKLRFMNARRGILNCVFAGEKYETWNIIFSEAGSDYEILDFEYEEDGRGITLHD
jgi:hypothetical protein